MARWIEGLCLTLGVAGLAIAGAGYVDSTLNADLAVAKIKQAQAAGQAFPENTLALLRISRLDIEVPVFEGTDRVTLNRGAGVVEGSPDPGEPGNLAVSAHRDSFFRPLEDIKIGDDIELTSASGTSRYEVTEIFITDALDISVLDPTQNAILTLITCYPFNYVGFAPDRFIVRSMLVGRDAAGKETRRTNT